MLKRLKTSFSRHGFAAVELLIVLTLLVGVAAATRLVQQAQNPEKRASSLPAQNNFVPKGYIDGADNASCTVWGWACDPDNYDPPLNVTFFQGSTPLNASVVADKYAADMPSVCGGFGSHRFEYTFPPEHTIRGAGPIELTARADDIDILNQPSGTSTKLTNSGTVFINCPLPTIYTGCNRCSTSYDVCNAIFDSHYQDCRIPIANTPVNYSYNMACVTPVPGKYNDNCPDPDSNRYYCERCSNDYNYLFAYFVSNIDPQITNSPNRCALPVDDTLANKKYDVDCSCYGAGRTTVTDFTDPQFSYLDQTKYNSCVPPPVDTQPPPVDTQPPPVDTQPPPVDTPLPLDCNSIPSLLGQNASPSTGTIQAGLQDIIWGAVNGAMNYSLRVDDLADDWPPDRSGSSGTCDDLINSGNPDDICVDGLTPNRLPFQYDFKPGHNYKWWVHAFPLTCNGWEYRLTVDNVQVEIPPSPTPVTEEYQTVFVSSATYDGNLGGIVGADNKCNSLASAASLTGNYKALLSDLNSDAIDNILPTNTALPYRLVDGTLIADNFADLFDGSLHNTITIDENGVDHSADFTAGTNLVFTGSNAAGTKFDTNRDFYCTNWSTALPSSQIIQAAIGNLGTSTSHWISQSAGPFCADQTRRLYCFQSDSSIREIYPTPTVDPNQPSCSIGFDKSNLTLALGETTTISGTITLGGTASKIDQINITKTNDQDPDRAIFDIPNVPPAADVPFDITVTATTDTSLIGVQTYSATATVSDNTNTATCDQTLQISVGDTSLLPPATEAGWYAPSGKKCHYNDVVSYYAPGDDNCNLTPVGYRTEGIMAESCSEDGTSGKCFKAYGNFINRNIGSQMQDSTGKCDLISSQPLVPMFSDLYQCEWFQTPPAANLDGTVTVLYDNTQLQLPFDRIDVYLYDKTSGDVNPLPYNIFPENESVIVNGNAYNFNFDNLDRNKLYEVTVSVTLGSTVVTGPDIFITEPLNCYGALGSCNFYPPNKATFIVDFLHEFGRSGGPFNTLSTNQAFQEMIDAWQNGELTALDMSHFILGLTRVPSLQKATCDPRVPGGCIAPQ